MCTYGSHTLPVTPDVVLGIVRIACKLWRFASICKWVVPEEPLSIHCTSAWINRQQNNISFPSPGVRKQPGAIALLRLSLTMVCLYWSADIECASWPPLVVVLEIATGRSVGRLVKQQYSCRKRDPDNTISSLYSCTLAPFTLAAQSASPRPAATLAFTTKSSPLASTHCSLPQGILGYLPAQSS